MSLVLRLIIGSFVFCLSSVVSATSPMVDFVLAPEVYLSGGNSDVSFDVASALYESGSPIPAPHLDTTHRGFEGVFYLSGAGWVYLSTGSTTVGIDCGAQSLTGITTSCQLTGTGWSEMFGDIDFSHVSYLSGGVLSGSIQSVFVGSYRLDGIMLPLMPAALSGSTYTGLASDHMHLEISHPSTYTTSGGLWQTTITPSGTMYPGTDMIVDMSGATNYTLIIQDPNGSQTTYTYTIQSGPPDEGHSSFTVTPGSILADGTDTSSLTLALRDQYNNPITYGHLDIVYKDMINLDQVSGIPSGDAMKYSMLSIFDGYNLFPSSTVTGSIDLNSSSTPLTYSFSSYAPGTIQAPRVYYDHSLISWLSHPDITVTPLYTANIGTDTPITIGSPVGFSGTLTPVSPTSLPTSVSLLHTFQIGSGFYAAYTDFTGSLTEECQANQVNIGSYSVPYCPFSEYSASLYRYTLPGGGSTFTFTGTYTPLVPISYVPPETATIDTSITYTIGAKTTTYTLTSFSTSPSTLPNPRIRIIGQHRATPWYGGLDIDTQSRATTYNMIRKNTALLTRHRDNFAGADFIYTGSHLHYTDEDIFDHARAIIVEGGDIFIDTGVTLHDRPVVFVALVDPSTGNGGHIMIATGVTDLHASLIAERHISSMGSGQLYIHGSIISYNTIEGTTCPYYSTSCTNAQDYDLQYLRRGYSDDGAHVHAVSPTAQEYRDVGLIIEYDPRIASDPPPGLQ